MPIPDGRAPTLIVPSVRLADTATHPSVAAPGVQPAPLGATFATRFANARMGASVDDAGACTWASVTVPRAGVVPPSTALAVIVLGCTIAAALQGRKSVSPVAWTFVGGQALVLVALVVATPCPSVTVGTENDSRVAALLLGYEPVPPVHATSVAHRTRE